MKKLKFILLLLVLFASMLNTNIYAQCTANVSVRVNDDCYDQNGQPKPCFNSGYANIQVYVGGTFINSPGTIQGSNLSSDDAPEESITIPSGYTFALITTLRASVSFNGQIIQELVSNGIQKRAYVLFYCNQNIPIVAAVFPF